MANNFDVLAVDNTAFINVHAARSIADGDGLATLTIQTKAQERGRQ